MSELSAMHSRKTVVVTPVYEDLEASSRLFMELLKTLGQELFIVAVDDGSVRHPLTEAALGDAAGVILKLRRNVGHQKAIAIGLAYVTPALTDVHRVIVMDSDGEDVPSTISDLLEALKIKDVDVAVSHRKSRIETWRFKAFYIVYKSFFRIMTGRKISFGNFMALKPSAVRRLVCMHELPIHIAGAVLASKLRIAVCPIDRGPRYAGKSKMNFVGLALHGFKGLMIFAEDVLVRVGIGCALTAIVAIVGSVVAISLKLLGLASPGWFSVALGIMMLIVLQTGALALMTLMLTGIVRSGAVVSKQAHLEFIDRVLTRKSSAHPRHRKKS